MGFKREAKKARRAIEGASNEAVNTRKFLTEEAWPEVQEKLEDAMNEVVNARKFITEEAWPDVQKNMGDAKNEAVNARKFLTEKAWPDVQKNMEEMRDTVTFAARMVVLLVALCVCIYISLKLQELVLASGVPAVVKTIVNWLCFGLFLVVFTTIFVMIFHLFHEMDLYNYIVVFITEFWDI
jgi:vacuolar-type H+-ATPase subunit H